MNELFWFVMLLCNFTLIMFAFRRWGKLGLFIWVPISVIVANIQVTKNVMLFGLEATLGNIVYATGFLATDIPLNSMERKSRQKRWPSGFSVCSP